MRIQLDRERLSYGMNCSPLKLAGTSLGGMLCRLDPGETSVFHKHHETELFVFLSGTATVVVGNEEVRVSPNDCVLLRPFLGHTVENTSRDASVAFLALYWEERSEPTTTARVASRELIFSTPPTPNGDLHLGHLSGPYLAADVYRRYLKLKGVSAVHVTGRDDNQTYVLRTARNEGRSPEAAADDYSAKIQKTLAAADIPIDYFSSPVADPLYVSRVQETFSRLYETGFIVEKEVEELYDEVTGYCLHEGYVTGTCPHCGCGSDGNACEQCGRPNDCVDLVKPRATLQGAVLGRRRGRKLYFAMSRLTTQLDGLVRRSNMSPRARALSASMLADGLPDICVSHASKWGIPVPVEGFGNQVIYAWFEMAAGYLRADAQCSNGRPFFEEAGVPITHFYGFDNTYYHTLLFPAVYFALGRSLNVPTNHVVNELLYLRGEKFSTSRRHLIWASSLLGHVASDYVRWGLSCVRPESGNCNFDLEEFRSSANAFFSGALAKWISHSADGLALAGEGVVPEPGAWTQEHTRFFETMSRLAGIVETSYRPDGFSPRLITSTLQSMVSLALDFISVQLRHENVPALADYRRTTVALNFWALRQFALLALPVIPQTAAAILRALRVEERLPVSRIDFVNHGQPLEVAHFPVFCLIPADIGERVL